MINRLIKLDGACNVRELGGYKTNDGHHTLEGVFIRSDSTYNLSKSDIELLKNKGLTMVIDLRSLDELSEKPSKFENCELVRYESIEMFDNIQPKISNNSSYKINFPDSMSELYIYLLDNCQSKYKQIFHLFLQNEKLTLFNCTAGKDRTGIVAMLLLELSGVNDETIIDDYSISEHNMKYAIDMRKQELKQKSIYIPNHVFESKPKDMKCTLDYLRYKYGNSENYLIKCGLSKNEISILKNRFVG